MKVFALVIVLVSVCSMEGALVKREADPIPPQLTEIVKRIQDYFQRAHSYMTTELAQQEKLEELKIQAQNYVQALREHVDPVTAQVREGLNQVLTSVLDAARTFAQKPVESS